ncbi:hypothetical protein EQG49_11850 [Periweissella cryptocerci]|uniref:Uncharacterized protein n=1 Tax=Periweissella cryptocerci TaxID=2506420 RepID=A0A4P6YWG0_9LACO|nr:hypothetical protein [Periweissella cryptocerci]QBO37097.1 hypothetical protein EQG49_11850 [Periweissella cryptocerci]
MMNEGQRNKDNKLYDEMAELLATDTAMHEAASAQMDTNYRQLEELKNNVQSVKNQQVDILDDLDALLAANVKTSEFDDFEQQLAEESSEKRSRNILQTMDISDDWKELLEDNRAYAKEINFDISNPYLKLFSTQEFATLSHQLVDKYEISKLEKKDYAFAAVVGIIMGLVDAFLVGSITDGNNPLTKNAQGKLSKEVDNLYASVVQKMGRNIKINEILANKNDYIASQAKKGLQPSSKKLEQFDSLVDIAKNADRKKAIGYLEKHFKVNYDASNNAHVLSGNVTGINASNHHLLSLSHDPGPMGLIMGIFDQLTNKSTMIGTDGSIVRVVTDNASSLSGEGNIIKRIIDAVVNWFGHTMSDVAGTSGSVGRGAGLPVPFYAITQELQFGKFDANGSEMNAAGLAESLYKQGYDVRAFTAQAIPVLVAEVLVRLYWAFKQKFYYGKTWKESLPIGNKPDLAKLLLVAIATFETIDVADAIMRNGITPAILFRLNFGGLVDLGFRSIQVARNYSKHIKHLQKLDDDLQAEWDRLLVT